MRVNSLGKSVDRRALALNVVKTLRSPTIMLSYLVYAFIVIAYQGINANLLILGFILFTALYGVVAIQNDLSDKEVDKINEREDIPFANDTLSKRQMTNLSFILCATATLSGYLINYNVLPLVAAYVFLGWVYSGPLNVKSRGIYAALLLGFCYGAMPWLIGIVSVSLAADLALTLVVVASFTFSTGIIVLKDFKDIKGDRATKKNTILVIKGTSFTRRYYLTVTTLGYITLITSAAVQSSAILSLIPTVVGLVNYIILSDSSITNNPHVRSRKGKLARLLFFCSAAILVSLPADL